MSRSKSAARNALTHFELRGVYGKNVLDFDKALRNEVKTKLDANGMGVVSIGSPIGKVGVTDPWKRILTALRSRWTLPSFRSAVRPHLQLLPARRRR